MYTRGQFAVIGKVGRKALRLYHEEGLLVPACINEENGYHYYEEGQLAVLEKIRRLRQIGLSLFEIRQVLEGKADENEAVRSRITELDEQLQAVKELAAGKAGHHVVLRGEVVHHFSLAFVTEDDAQQGIHFSWFHFSMFLLFVFDSCFLAFVWRLWQRAHVP